ncbi:MAG: hypothetical protein Ct9H300mP23_10280 [Nitrospinota bacterium]|nr:MAG: hypothetical protein Ct9H300mP23_10280 [Nitrospinota bacterium]
MQSLLILLTLISQCLKPLCIKILHCLIGQGFFFFNPGCPFSPQWISIAIYSQAHPVPPWLWKVVHYRFYRKHTQPDLHKGRMIKVTVSRFSFHSSMIISSFLFFPARIKTCLVEGFGHLGLVIIWAQFNRIGIGPVAVPESIKWSSGKLL